MDIIKFTLRMPKATGEKLRKRVYRLKSKDRTMSENKFILEILEEKLKQEDSKQ